MSKLKECWEYKACGRQKNGPKVAELGECIASKEQMGHSCWAIAGTLCGGVVQGSSAQKEQNCMGCEVYKIYHRITGKEGKQVGVLCPEEESKYNEMMRARIKRKAG